MISNFIYHIKEIRSIIISIIINIGLTLYLWVYVYGMQIDTHLASSLYLISTNQKTEVNILYDLLNGLKLVATVSLVAFVAVFVVLNNCRWLIKIWLYTSFLLLLVFISGSIIYDWISYLNLFSEVFVIPIASCLTGTYAIFGIVSFFTEKFTFLRHFYIICNSSFISSIYLRASPGYTTWFLLLALSFWDIFAVCTPIGPLRLLREKAGEYDDEYLHFLMYDAKPAINKAESHSNLECKEERSILEKKRLVAGKEVQIRTVEETWNDGSLRLGTGDYVFYSVLVGAAATYGNIFSTLAAIFGLLFGVVCTFAYPMNNSGDMDPALPIPLLLGTLSHFSVIGVFKWIVPLIKF